MIRIKHLVAFAPAGVALCAHVALSACTPELKEKQVQEDAAACQTQYQAKPGTPAFTQCMLVLEQRRLDRRAAAAAAMSAIGAGMQQQAARSTYTTCNRFGNTVNCSSY
jgi:hypothetical protein